MQSTLCYLALDIRDSGDFFLSPLYKIIGIAPSVSDSGKGKAVVSLRLLLCHSHVSTVPGPDDSSYSSFVHFLCSGIGT